MQDRVADMEAGVGVGSRVPVEGEADGDGGDGVNVLRVADTERLRVPGLWLGVTECDGVDGVAEEVPVPEGVGVQARDSLGLVVTVGVPVHLDVGEQEAVGVADGGDGVALHVGLGLKRCDGEGVALPEAEAEMDGVEVMERVRVLETVSNSVREYEGVGVHGAVTVVRVSDCVGGETVELGVAEGEAVWLQLPVPKTVGDGDRERDRLRLGEGSVADGDGLAVDRVRVWREGVRDGDGSVTEEHVPEGVHVAVSVPLGVCRADDVRDAVPVGVRVKREAEGVALVGVRVGVAVGEHVEWVGVRPVREPLRV